MDAKPYKQEKKENDIYLIPIVKPHTQTLIWLHGLGDSPLGYLDMFNSYESPIPFNFKIILLCAPKVKFTLYNNQITTSWFDILEPGFRDEKSYNYSDVEKNKLLPKKNKNGTKKVTLSKKQSLLDSINKNIERNQINLNNPDLFYTNYFHSILDKKKEKNGENNLKKEEEEFMNKLEKKSTLHRLNSVNLFRHYDIKNQT